ncbi:MAG TPA: hypothetical protein VH249_09970 [Xanthobacteraceae bacterium]|jgi:hypothetical protein|nr:hypothetical protein [Xanthobacteraceae bacterium]
MRKFVMVLAGPISFALLTSAASAQDCVPPEPKSIAGICNKEAGGYYDCQQKKWFIRMTQTMVMAKNNCVDRMAKARKKH